jgi:hypothetical protein
MAGGQHVQLHQDGGEQVVEVVRHAAGQLADGLHLLALAELRSTCFCSDISTR